MRVAIARTEPTYPPPPFHPSECYPEYPFGTESVAAEPNHVYAAVRQCLRRLGLDAARYGTPQWNPLGSLVGPGARVILKPNFVHHRHPRSEDEAHFQALVTHPAVLRVLADYVMVATRGDVTLTVTDLPMQSADFQALRARSGLDRAFDFLSSKLEGRGTLRVLDLRGYWLRTDLSDGIIERLPLPGDAAGYVTVDLQGASSLSALEATATLFRAPDYDGRTTVDMHTGGRHRYVLPRTVLDATAFINVPKLKVHRKVGATLSLKNLVGIIGDKTCLPHWRAGAPAAGGDEYAVDSMLNRMASRWSYPLRKIGGPAWSAALSLARMLKRVDGRFRGDEPIAHAVNGDWYGNDTIWRTVHDLNRILFHADADGRLHDRQQRAYLTVVDGVMAGEGEGPLSPTPLRAGVIVGGTDPLAVDITCARLMGFDWRRVPQFACYDANGRYPFSSFTGDPDAIDVRPGDEGCGIATLQPLARFAPAAGWRGHIELA